MITAFVDGDRGGNLIIKELLNVADIDYVTKAPDGKEVEELLCEFHEKILPYCTNFSSRNFMGFPDAGHKTSNPADEQNEV